MKPATAAHNRRTRAPLKLHLQTGQLHRDLGKPAGAVITTSDIAKEKARGGVFAKRAQFAENARRWRHAGKKKS